MSENSMPKLGFGTFDLDGEDGIESVATALDVGYRHVDTAYMYGNESVVGAGLERAPVDREDVFVATKVGHFTEPPLTPEYVRSCLEESLTNLGVDAVDILYIHWPTENYDPETILPAIDELVEEGATRALGVSNFRIDQLEMAREIAASPIVANQVEMHPYLQQRDLLEYCRANDISLVAYAPLAQGQVFDDPTLTRIADDHGVSVPQVTLAWLLQYEPVVAIPKASSDAHIRDNYGTLDVDLDAEDIEAIEAIEHQTRIVDPDWMSW